MSRFIDIHTHWCLFGRDPQKVSTELEWLEQRGYEKLAVYPLPSLGATPEKVLDMVPGAYRELVGLNPERTANDDLESWLEFERQWKAKPRTLELLSFLDVRAWDGKKDLTPWWAGGHTGLKSILIEEEDGTKMAMPPLRSVNQTSRAGYLEAQRAVFEAADRYGVPLVYHVDLSLHLGFVEECLGAYPNLRVNIPHLGFSRRLMGELFNRFPALYSDLSSLGPHIEKKPDSYRSFILNHPDRIMLGSDVIASFDMRQAYKYVDWIKNLSLPTEVESSVFFNNARRFLGE